MLYNTRIPQGVKLTQLLQYWNHHILIYQHVFHMSTVSIWEGQKMEKPPLIWYFVNSDDLFLQQQ